MLILKFFVLFFIHLVSSIPIERRWIEEATGWINDVKEDLFTGPGTYFNTGSGSCGEYSVDTDLIVAVSRIQMENGTEDSNPNHNYHCDKTVNIQGDYGTISAKVVDTCRSCKEGGLDMSPTVFEKVCGPLSEGVCNISWRYE